MEHMDKLCEVLERELDAATEEAVKTGVSEKMLNYIDKLAHSLKSVKTIEAMEGGYSSENGYSGYHYYDRGNSYARRRDANGRYSRQSFADRLERMSEEAPDEETRAAMRRMLDNMR